MTEEPATDLVNDAQEATNQLLNGMTNGEEEDNDDNDNKSNRNNEEEEDNAASEHPNTNPEEEEDNEKPKGELEGKVEDTTNALLGKTEEEENPENQEAVAVSEPKSTSEASSRRPKRKKNHPIDQDIQVVIPDLPFAPQPKDPNIVHYIFEYDDGGVKRNSTRNKNNAFSARSKYNSTTHYGSPPENGGSLYDNSPYFSKPISIYKAPPLVRSARAKNNTLTSRSRSTDRNMTSQQSNYSNTNSVYESTRSNYMSYSRRYSTRPPPKSNYVERTKEFEQRQRKYDTEFVERYKQAHPLPLYQPHYQKTVLQMKIERQRLEERKYRKAAEEAKKKRIKNRKNHDEFIKKTEDFGNEGEVKPKYLENLSQRKDYLDLDIDSSEEEQNEKQNQSRSNSKQSAKTNNTENQSEKGKLEGQMEDTANNLLGDQDSQKKNNEEEEEEDNHEKKDNEEEEKEDEKKEEEEKNEEEENEEN